MHIRKRGTHMNYPNLGNETVIICPQCGAQNAANVAVCRSCGVVLNEQQMQYQDPQYQGQYDPQYQDPQYQGQYDPQYQDQYDMNQDAQQNKLMAVLAYFGILVLIPIFAAPNSRFARFHANQGLVLWLVGFVLNLIVTVIPPLAFLGFLGIVLLVFSIMGIVNAVKGEMKELPLFGKVTLLK